MKVSTNVGCVGVGEKVVEEMLVEVVEGCVSWNDRQKGKRSREF